GYLYALDDTELVADQKEFLDVPVGSTQYQGKTYGVPQVTDSLALMYNKKLLEQADVEVPTTWDDLATAAAKIKSATGKKGVYLNPAGYYLLPFIYGEGGDLLDPEAKAITVGSDAAVAGATKAADLLGKPGFAKPPATDAYNAMMNSFKSGKAAMIVNGPWEVKNVQGAKGFGGADNLGIAPVPAGSERAGAPVGGHDYVVWSGMPAEKADAAVAFIQFMSSEESQVEIANELGLLPTRAAAYDKVDNPIVGAFEPVMAAAVPRAWIPEGGQLFAPLDDAATEIMVQGADPKATLAKVAKKYKSEVVPKYTVK
ncbi:MAG: extracellular solute-binding protein, partial [Thermocrispum sp.]